MPYLSIVVPNRNRIYIENSSENTDNYSVDSSLMFFKSLQWQDNKDFELIIVDGGSENYNDLKAYCETKKDSLSFRVIYHKLGNAWEKCLLNNIGIQNATGEYIVTTDADMIFRRDFVDHLISFADKKSIVESKTFHLKKGMVEKIHRGEIDPYTEYEKCKIGRAAGKATGSPGGCQCLHRDNWFKLRGYDEKYIGWGSEDRDLLKRAGLFGFREKWAATSLKDIRILHQEHYKDVERNLKDQEKNKQRLMLANKSRVNCEKWGEIKD